MLRTNLSTRPFYNVRAAQMALGAAGVVVGQVGRLAQRRGVEGGQCGLAADPVGATKFFFTMLRVILRDLLGVDAPLTGRQLPADGCAANGRGGIFGDIDALFGATETRGRASARPVCWADHVVCHPPHPVVAPRLSSAA